MKEQEIINDVENLIKSYADSEGNIKHWKARNIADRIVKNCNLQNVSGSLPLQTKLEMFYDFLFDNGLANSFKGDIDKVAREFIQKRLESNDR